MKDMRPLETRRTRMRPPARSTIAQGTITWIGALAIVSALSAPAAGQTREDEIHLKDGKKITKIEIMKETCETVTYKQGGTRQEVGADKVADIRYGDRPLRYSQAYSNFVTGRFTKAIEDLDMLIGSPGNSTWLKQYSLHLKGKCLLALSRTEPGLFEDAVDTFQTFVDEKSWADHRMAPEMLRGLGDSLVGAGRLDEAGVAFDTLAGLGCPGPWQINGKYGKGLILIKQSKYQEARSLLEDVVQKTSGRAGSEDLHGLARCAVGEAWLAEESYGNAIDQYQSVVKAGEREFSRSGALFPILARAYNGLGDAYRMRAEKRDDKKDFREAAVAYLHVVVLFSGPTNERAHALEHGAKSCQQVGWTDMAKSLSEELQAR